MPLGTVGDVDEATLRGLYATVPTEFVAARNALVKELRRAKERDEAAVVAALRKPDWTDWALNVVAAEHADAVDEFATAASDVRDAQAAAIEGRDGPDVRAALRTLRERTTDVSRKAAAVLERRRTGTGHRRADGPPVRDRRATRRRPTNCAWECSGSGEPDVSDPFGGLEPADQPEPASGRARPSGRHPASGRRLPRARRRISRRRSEPTPSAADRQRIKRDRDRAEQARKAAVRELAAADAELEKATAAVATAQEKLADAERRQAEATRAPARPPPRRWPMPRPRPGGSLTAIS